MVINRFYGRSFVDWQVIDNRALIKTGAYLLDTNIIPAHERVRGNSEFDKIFLHFALCEVCETINKNTTNYPASFIVAGGGEFSSTVNAVKKILPFVSLIQAGNDFDEFVLNCETKGEYAELILKDNRKRKKTKFSKIKEMADKYDLKWLSEVYFETLESRCLCYKS